MFSRDQRSIGIRKCSNRYHMGKMIECAKKLGERYMGIVGLRDPHVVRHVD